MSSFSDAVCDYIRTTWQTEPQYLWTRSHDSAVFRHQDNQKIFARLMQVSRSELGLYGDDPLEILTVKPGNLQLADYLLQQEGYIRGYRMNRGDWVSICLDGTVPLEDICQWIDMSYLATASSETKQRLRPPKEWIIPSNPKYFDIVGAFREREEINWKQGKGIKKGDIVYMYVAAPVSAVLYKCIVTETDIPYLRESHAVRIKSLMRIRLLRCYPPERFTFEVLGREYGIFAVRGPRGIPEKLSRALNPAE